MRPWTSSKVQVETLKIIKIADPIPGQEPGDQVRSFVFMSNLASQETSGERDISVSVERIITDLAGSTELVSQLFVATLDDAVPLHATVPAGTDDEPWIEAEGWVKINLPLIDDTASASLEITLDAGHQPLPDQPLTDEAGELIHTLLAHAETVAGAPAWSRRILHTAHMHKAGADTRVCDYCARLIHAGYSAAHEEIQQVVDLSGVSPDWDAPGMTVHRILGTDFPTDLIDGIVELQDLAATDIPHGTLTTDPARWSPRRLAEQSERIRQTGAQLLTVVFTDAVGVVAMSTVSLPPGSNPDVAEQGLTIVHPRARGRQLGRAVKLACLNLLRDRHPAVRRVATSNAVDNQGMLAINRALGAREISRTTLWEKKI